MLAKISHGISSDAATVYAVSASCRDVMKDTRGGWLVSLKGHISAGPGTSEFPLCPPPADLDLLTADLS
ncbi:hypothetical protein CKAH01_02881 [Colletotrichum kahawae]|uniref:Uncharacterized protein n=1 Tax=Colletotrichum kahawae TaxID=34407 RepID=A0AAD9XWM8_COLKA|nr:hypothetical protein CKAH01_02881 [Colletotrichum kahawae]